MFNSNCSTFSMPVVPMGYTNGNCNNNGNSWGDDWLALAALALIFGWGNGFFGFGGFGGGMNGMMNPLMLGGFPYGSRSGSDCATQADVRAAVDQQTLISKIDQQTYGLADSTYALNNAITGGLSDVQQTMCQGFNGINTAILQSANGTERGFADLSSQLASCCCNTQRAIEGVNYNIATQTNAIQNAICNSTRDITENANANSRAILDFLVQDKISTLQEENQALKLKASQAAQNQYLVNELRPCPIPAYVTCNPWASSYSYNGYGACGCGCN